MMSLCHLKSKALKTYRETVRRLGFIDPIHLMAKFDFFKMYFFNIFVTFLFFYFWNLKTQSHPHTTLNMNTLSVDSLLLLCPWGEGVTIATLVQRRGFGLIFLSTFWKGSYNPTPPSQQHHQSKRLIGQPLSLKVHPAFFYTLLYFCLLEGLKFYGIASAPTATHRLFQG